MTTSAQLHFAAQVSTPPTRVLIVEDDAADALLVESMLDGIGNFELQWTRAITDIPSKVREVDCILLDLGLPGARGFEALEHTLAVAANIAVVVLTGLNDESRGEDAVAAGAQDFLVKGQVDGPLLARSLLYAVQRHRADENARLLYQAGLLKEHNARFERGLLPRTDSSFRSVEVATWYRAGIDQALVGGDFYDVIGCPDGCVRAVIGDVSGHGPDEAALGVALRAAWRALVLAGVDDGNVFSVLNRMIVTERHTPEIYATASMVTISPDCRSISMRVAGHPQPVMFHDKASTLDLVYGPALGLFDEGRWPVTTISPEPGWRLLLYTDGIIEGLDGESRDRLGVEGLVALVDDLQGVRTTPDEFLRSLVAGAEQTNGGPLIDDVALVLFNELLTK